MNTILEGPCRMPFYTDLEMVFKALGRRQSGYNWLLTDLDYRTLDADQLPPELAPDLVDGTYRLPREVWLSGKRLGEIAASRQIQFVWATLSGFGPGMAIDPANLEVYPFADGNPGFWQPGVAIQHPGAAVEIVCWDSTCTLLLAKDDDLTRSFREFFPEAVDLDVFNRSRAEARSQDHQ